MGVFQGVFFSFFFFFFFGFLENYLLTKKKTKGFFSKYNPDYWQTCTRKVLVCNLLNLTTAYHPVCRSVSRFSFRGQEDENTEKLWDAAVLICFCIFRVFFQKPFGMVLGGGERKRMRRKLFEAFSFFFFFKFEIFLQDCVSCLSILTRVTLVAEFCHCCNSLRNIYWFGIFMVRKKRSYKITVKENVLIKFSSTVIDLKRFYILSPSTRSLNKKAAAN